MQTDELKLKKREANFKSIFENLFDTAYANVLEIISVEEN